MSVDCCLLSSPLQLKGLPLTVLNVHLIRPGASLARHTPQSKGKEGSGDSAYCELFWWNAIIANFERRAQDNIFGELPIILINFWERVFSDASFTISTLFRSP